MGARAPEKKQRAIPRKKPLDRLSSRMAGTHLTRSLTRAAMEEVSREGEGMQRMRQEPVKRQEGWIVRRQKIRRTLGKTSTSVLVPMLHLSRPRGKEGAYMYVISYI